MKRRWLPEPIDRVAVSAMAVIAGLTLAVLASDRWIDLGGGRPRVEDFTWHDGVVSAQDRAFILTFNRPVDRAAVEANLQIDPPLPGKWSWVGRRAAYTLTGPIPYGTTYTLELAGVREQFSSGGDRGRTMQPFSSQFQSRDRAFAYIGTNGEERGRIVLYNLTRQEKQILTPPGLAVTDFQPYPGGDRLLFGAIDTREGQTTDLTPRLYRIGTEPETAADLELVLDSQTHQNLQFALAEGGETIVVQRASREDASDVGVWVLRPEAAPKILEASRNGGEFRVTPDGAAVAVAQGEGIVLIPLHADRETPNFLPEFGRVLAFAPNGREAVLVDFNVEDADRRFLQTLVRVTSNGSPEPLLDTEGAFLDCQYATAAPQLFCAFTELEITETITLPDPESLDPDRAAQPEVYDDFIERTILGEIALDTGEVMAVSLPEGARETSFSLSPDGLAILFDRLPPEDTLLEPELATSWLWLWLPGTEPEAIPLQGRQPQWLP